MAPKHLRWAVELRDPSWLHDDVFATFLPMLTRGRPPVERAQLVVTAITRGASLEANIALVNNNARLGAQVAKAYAALS